MNNQAIGIAGVFALTFFLLAVRYCLLSLGRSNRNRHFNPALQRRGAESNPGVVEDDSWLLWSSDSETSSPNRTGEATSAPRTPIHKDSPPLRVC